MKRVQGAAVVALVVVGVASTGTKVSADECKPDRDGAGTTCDGRNARIALTTIQLLGASAPTVGLATEISKGRRPNPGWLASGLITGISAISAGAVAWDDAAHSPDNVYDYDESKFWIAGLPGIVIGISNIVMFVYGLTLPGPPDTFEAESKGAQLSFAPLVAPDGQGGYYSGVGVSVVGW